MGHYWSCAAFDVAAGFFRVSRHRWFRPYLVGFGGYLYLVSLRGWAIRHRLIPLIACDETQGQGLGPAFCFVQQSALFDGDGHSGSKTPKLVGGA